MRKASRWSRGTDATGRLSRETTSARRSSSIYRSRSGGSSPSARGPPPAGARCVGVVDAPPQVPPLASWSAAHRRVSSGRSGSGARSGCGARAASAASSGPSVPSAARRRGRSCLPGAAVDHDPDQVAVAQLADRAAGQRLGADVADAGAGGDAGEARVGEDGDVLAERQVLERRGDLVDLLHARAQRPAADQHEDVAGLDRSRRGS